jgi:hypothetical protein
MVDGVLEKNLGEDYNGSSGQTIPQGNVFDHTFHSVTFSTFRTSHAK